MIHTVKPDKTSYKTQFSPLITIYHNIDNNNIFKHIFESDFTNDPTQYLHTFVLSFIT